jgi:hypothetical protein
MYDDYHYKNHDNTVHPCDSSLRMVVLRFVFFSRTMYAAAGWSPVALLGSTGQLHHALHLTLT